VASVVVRWALHTSGLNSSSAGARVRSARHLSSPIHQRWLPV